MTGRTITGRAAGEASVKGRRELAALNDALTLAERGLGRQTTAALMARLLRVAAMFPRSVDDTLMWQVTDLVTGDDVSDGVKLTLIRMGWASIVQAQYRAHGLRMAAAPKCRQAAAA
ncbi:hypothetical protein HUE56_18630 [Azospirillum oryzae]|uniref:Uncharacterized protein n=1 Tax=Azospirillum oryzae TaxID=286727 RepID=A0A6N1AT28_9PROT|nr:hypothetical protein [Azospirillum oryzae]KAA0591116.1 hypothetical protein FZ938_03210 [Azospirillum oryzae]QKS52404.1 hypothetical protein HUE56_18630 [Azospirillum oryzae]GLR78027.1 hypothetical protein GCM10007856_06970 [Azospirillum oryzae]